MTVRMKAALQLTNDSDESFTYSFGSACSGSSNSSGCCIALLRNSSLSYSLLLLNTNGW